MSHDVIVVGAGVVGASIAYHLTRLGVAPLLIDQSAPGSAPSASWASAGGLRTQGRSAAERPLSLAAAKRWLTLPDELDADLEVRLGGHLHLAETEAETEIVEARIAGDRAGGIEIERVEAAELAGLAPGLKPGLVLGAYTPGDGQAHPARTAQAFCAAAMRLGATVRLEAVSSILREDQRVAGIVMANGETLRGGAVVLATGAWSIGLLGRLGIELPLRWRGLQMLLSDVAAPALAPTVTAVGRNLSLKQSPSGQFMVGGRWFGRPVAEGIGATPIDSHVARQWDGAVAILPGMAQLRIAQSWAGAEAQSIDSLPFIGRALPGLYLALGFSNHGFQISPAVGDFVARDLASGSEPLLAPFSPDRIGQTSAADWRSFIDEPLDA
jgi:glycine/D-amino acid oxidase-like deaminating enzyme